MNLRSIVIASLTLAALAVPALAAPGQSPSVYSNIKDTNLNLAACMAHAREVLARNGVSNISNGKWSTYGQYQGHTVLLRCVEEKQFVFIVVSGDVYETCERLTNAVQADF